MKKKKKMNGMKFSEDDSYPSDFFSCGTRSTDYLVYLFNQIAAVDPLLDTALSTDVVRVREEHVHSIARIIADELVSRGFFYISPFTFEEVSTSIVNTYPRLEVIGGKETFYRRSNPLTRLSSRLLLLSQLHWRTSQNFHHRCKMMPETQK